MNARITKKEVREEPDRENRARLESLRQKQEMRTRATPATRAEQREKATGRKWNQKPIPFKTPKPEIPLGTMNIKDWIREEVMIKEL